MPRMTEEHRQVTGGVDTHAEVHVTAVVDLVGRVLGTEAFPATAGGYVALLAWLRSFGRLVQVGSRAPAATVPGWPATWPVNGCGCSR
jgi:hypothetical protein